MLAEAGMLVMASAPDAATLLKEGREADIIIVRAPLPVEFFDDPPRLRVAIRHGAGLDMIPVDAATRAGVLVANVPGVNASAVAEHVVMVSLALLRRFRLVDRDLRNRGWQRGRAHADFGHELSGRVMGIIGMGHVGRAVHRIACHGFGLEVVATTRSPASLPDGVRATDLDTLMARADIVVLCCPLSPETRGLIGRKRIALMKPDAVLINVSRGPVVDEAALVETLRGGRIAGAALDVFETQPLPADHPLFTLDNVIITPHLAGITEESMLRMGVGAAQEAIRVLGGGLPRNFINPEAEPHYRERFPATG
jgi:D-3-phosphoglycerate dehydrogenase / 2-oxoglutarate reductase